MFGPVMRMSRLTSSSIKVLLGTNFSSPMVLVEDRVAAVRNRQGAGLVEDRSAIAEEPGGFREPARTSEFRQSRRPCPESLRGCSRTVSRSSANSSASSWRARSLRSEDLVLDRLEVRRDVTLPLHRGLLADVIGGTRSRDSTW